jgi:hypothetical protein
MLNFAVSDGETVVATRVVFSGPSAASLYFASGSRWSEDPIMKGEYRMLNEDRREQVVIIASERLTGTSAP